MKKILLIFIIVSLTSCAGLPGKSTLTVFSPIDKESGIYLSKINIEPRTALSGLAGEIPELVNSLLTSKGFRLVGNQLEADIELEIFIHRKSYTYNFNSFESVTMTMKLYQQKVIAAYLMYTEDTDRSLDSFIWTFSLLEHNIAALAARLHE